MTEHPWARQAPRAWRVASESGATAVTGLLLAAAVALPPLLPVALAGASTIAVRTARGLPVDPLGDALSAIRSDVAPFAVLTIAFALAAAIPAWLALAIGADEGLRAGVRLALLVLASLACAPLVLGAVIASATRTPTLSIPAAATALVFAHVRTALAVTAIVVVALAPVTSPAAPAILPITLGLGFRVAVALAWRAVERADRLAP
jgi:hypothetical protein